jgi:hypothetical protein
MLASARWLVYDDGADSARTVPLLAATHAHRHCRGRMLVGDKHWHVSRLSASYSLEFAAVFARMWKNAVQHLLASGSRCGLSRCQNPEFGDVQLRDAGYITFCDGCQRYFHRVHYRAHLVEAGGCVNDGRYFSPSGRGFVDKSGDFVTPLEARPRQRFSPVVPQVSCIGAVRLATDYQDVGSSPTDDHILLEEKGRALEKQEILEREQLADAFRGAEPAPGRKTFAVTVALRVALIEAQLRDPALAELRRRLAGRTESIAGSAGRIVVPAGNVEKLTPRDVVLDLLPRPFGEAETN